ncbi:MAG TPA: leucyl aminopeptidase [Edaphocola sp.]|nr:leucyl aminopeptidase [Edaphocola sp.]
MFLKIQKNPKGDIIYIFNDIVQLSEIITDSSEKEYINKEIKLKKETISINRYSHQLFFVFVSKEQSWEQDEVIRKAGATLSKTINDFHIESIYIDQVCDYTNAAYCLAEGIILSAYQFLKYKSDAKHLENSLKDIYFSTKSLSPKKLKELENITQSVYIARDLINEPLNNLTAEQLAENITKLGKDSGFRVQVLNKEKIEKLKMGGILAVNAGSQLPPTFSILEYRPLNYKNKAPIVLVGKGIVYDTGGLSLKPTANSMDCMKSDMSGAAVITGIMYAVAMMELPVYLVGLVPATENRPGENAYTPGDVITMHSGTTVEVLNTDAEGRLVLADALHYAKKYKPELVLDYATLTGSASNTFGDACICMLGNADEKIKTALKESGFNQFEKLAELPLWEEYGKMIVSKIADLKNIGGSKAGAITAAKFLEHFTDYPWIHFDIAGVSFNDDAKDYRPTGGVAMGIRMTVDFLKNKYS